MEEARRSRSQETEWKRIRQRRRRGQLRARREELKEKKSGAEEAWAPSPRSKEVAKEMAMAGAAVVAVVERRARRQLQTKRPLWVQVMARQWELEEPRPSYCRRNSLLEQWKRGSL